MILRNLFLALSILLLIARAMCSSAFAEDSTIGVSQAIGGAANPSAAQAAASTNDVENEKAVAGENGNTTTLHSLFYGALRQLYAPKKDLGESFQKLIQARDQEGYNNLPRYSETLFEHAKQAFDKGESDTAKQIISIALKLSPTDARVRSHAASLYQITGWGEAISNMIYSISLAIKYPSLVFSVILNLLVLSLIAGTSALLLVIILQISKNSETLLRLFQEKCAAHIGILGSAIAFCGLIVFPLAFGVLAIIVVGSAILSLSIRHCRSLAALVGVLTLVWGCSLIIVSTCGSNIREGIIRAVEDSAEQSYSPEDAVVISTAVKQEPSSALRLFAAARQVEKRHDDKRASKYYQVALKNSTDRSLAIAANNNLGVIAFRSGKFSEAREFFLAAEEEGGKSYELFSNLMRVSSSLLDPESQRSYFEKLRTYFPESAAAAQQSATGEAISMQIPVWLLYREVLRPSESSRGLRVTRTNALANSLLWHGTPGILIGVGVIYSLIGLSIWARWGKLRLSNVSDWDVEGLSTIWAVLPFGFLAAGKRPVAGTIGIAGIFAAIMLALDQPVRLYPVFESELPMTNLWVAVAVVIFLISASISIVQTRRLKFGSQLGVLN